MGLERVDTSAFRSPFLSWIGPWQAEFLVGWLDDERVAMNTAYAGFRGVEGIYFAEDRAEVAQAIDRALDLPQSVRDGLIRYWEANYSPRAVLAQWISYLEDVRKLKGQGAQAPSS